MIDDAVFVVGYARSGTTLLYRFLARSPAFGKPIDVQPGADAAFETAIAAFANPHIDRRKIAAQPWPHWRKAIPDERAFERFLAAGEMGPLRARVEAALTRFVYRDANIAVCTTDANSLAVRGMLGREVPGWIRRGATRLSVRREVIRAFMRGYAEAHRLPRLLEKYPFHYAYLDDLSVALPASQFVFIVRNPVDVFASMVHRARIELAERIPLSIASWMVLSAEAFAHDWHDALSRAERFAHDRAARLLFVSYRELTREPEATGARLERFLGIPLDLAEVNAAEPPVIDSTRRFPISSAIPAENPSRSHDELHPVDIATIERLCGEAIVRLRL